MRPVAVARAVRRALLPAHVRRDIRDHELLVELLERFAELFASGERVNFLARPR